MFEEYCKWDYLDRSLYAQVLTRGECPSLKEYDEHALNSSL
jgi:hypothetical protein